MRGSCCARSSCELSEGLLRLHCQAVRNVRTSVECFENVIADQATIFTRLALQRRHFDTPVTGVAFRTLNVGFFHARTSLVSCSDQ